MDMLARVIAILNLVWTANCGHKEQPKVVVAKIHACPTPSRSYETRIAYKGCFDDKTYTVMIDPRAPKWQLPEIVKHEAWHACKHPGGGWRSETAARRRKGWK